MSDWVKVRKNKLRVDLIKKHKSSGKVLDVGCGYGHFLKAMFDKLYFVYGLEMIQSKFEYARKLVPRVKFENFFNHQGSYDIITMWDVLEHIPERVAAVDKAYSLLNPDGIFVIQVPQADSFGARFAGYKWKYICPAHVNYFTKQSITVLLTLHGFKVLKIKSSWEPKNFLMSLKKRTEEEKQTDFDKIIDRPKWLLKIGLFFHDVILQILSFFRLGDEMIIIARKI